MRQSIFKSLMLIVVLTFASVAWAQDGSKNGILSHEAKNHIGEIAMVCGVIVGVHQESQPYSPQGGPGNLIHYSPIKENTSLYFDKLPPDNEFSVQIKDEYRKAFTVNPRSFVDRKACVYGKIAIVSDGRQGISLVRTDQIAVEDIEMGGK